VVEPEIVGCLGATATRAVLGPDVQVTKDRGRFFESPFAPATMPTFHPAAILRAPSKYRRQHRESLVEDLRKVAERL